MSGTELTPRTFDRMAPGRATTRTGIIWTLAGIADRIGVSADFVRDKLVIAEGSPVREIGGKFYAFEEDLIAFLKSERNKPSPTA